MLEQRRPPYGADTLTPAQRLDAELNHTRLVFCLTSLVGSIVSVRLRDQVYEGLFHSFSTEGDLAITLRYARRLPSDVCLSEEVIDTLCLAAKDFLQVTADGVEPFCPARELLGTDDEISQDEDAGMDEGELVPWGNGNEAGSTTKVDPCSIPVAKREEAKRIARQLESNAEGISPDLEDIDEEAPGPSSSSSKIALSVLPQVPLTRKHLSQHDSMSSTDPEFACEHRKKRGLITAHSAMQSPMISEMKRINALNLEPALPKLDDKTRNDWINFKQSQSRNALKPAQGNGLKNEFLQSLNLIRSRDGTKQKDPPPVPGASSTATAEQSALEQHGPKLGADVSGGSRGPVVAKSEASIQGAAPSPSSTGAAVDSKPSFAFNPAAASFSFNPGASVFTPTASSTSPPSFNPSTGVNQTSQDPASSLNNTVDFHPPFRLLQENSKFILQSLVEMLNPFLGSCSGESLVCPEPLWSEAVGPGILEALGRPTPGVPPPSFPGGAMPGGGAIPDGSAVWQQPMQAPNAQAGGAAHPMQTHPGYMAAPGVPSNQPPQMYQPMYQSPQGAMAAQGVGNMPMQGQPALFNQQGQQIVQQPMMAAGGQFAQGFAPQQVPVQPGQPGQPILQGQMPAGPYQMGPPLHGQMMQPGPMQPQPMYHQG